MNEYNRLKADYQKQIAAADYQQAVLTANQLSDIYPDDANLYNMLAHALKLSGHMDAALKCYEMSLLLDDNQANVHMVVGEILSLQGKRDQAFGYFLKGMELKPQTPEVLRKVGGFLIDAGYLDDAETLLQQAVGLGMNEALEDLLDLYDKRGDKDRLFEHLQQHRAYFATRKDSLSIAQALLSTGQINKAVAYLKCIEFEHKPRVWRRAYHNLLAQAYERLGFYQQAYFHYRDQNMNSQGRYERSASEQFMREVVDVADRILTMDRALSPILNDSFQPLFIVGLPRTGTSLLEQILSTRASVVPGGELSFIASGYQAYMGRQKTLQQVAEWYMNKLEFIVDNQHRSTDPVRWVVDKMPSNFVYIGFMRALFPGARFLYCRRDAIDTGFSIYKQNFNDSHRYASDLGDIAHFIAQERHVMQQWLHRFPDRILSVDYENIATDFDRETQRVFDFLNLEWDESVRDFYKNPEISNTASYNQVRSPIHGKAVGYYRNFEPFLGHLINGLEHYGIREHEKTACKVA